MDTYMPKAYQEDLKKRLSELKKIEGYPIGRDEDILNLSDPPHYTACPNPYINEFIQENGRPYNEEDDDYHREPFVADVSEGKKDPIYNAHSYHTKVPYKAIMPYILHYTEPEDIVFDGFCGTGMTGVAAQMCEIGSKVKEKTANSDEMKLWEQIEADFKDKYELGSPKWGARKAILADLCPAATFIAYNYNNPVDGQDFKQEAERILKEVEDECGWMYETWHQYSDGTKVKGKISYTVWSDVFICPYCGNEFIFWDLAVDKESGKVKDSFLCDKCEAEITKRECTRATVNFYDRAIEKEIEQVKQRPVLINYIIGKERYEKRPDQWDLDLIQKIADSDIPYWFPTDRMPDGDESRRNDKYGLTHVHHFYTNRVLYVLSCCFYKAINAPFYIQLKFLLTGIMFGITKLQRFKLYSTFPNMILSGTLYVGSQIREWNAIDWTKGKLKNINALYNKFDFVNKRNYILSCTNLVSNNLMNDSIDYIFTDPPFGDNLMYSELNFLWESWLKVKTNNAQEAIINKSQEKDLNKYAELMEQSFQEYYRVLKPGRWMTVVFHNSKSSVWNAIQDGITKAGFVVADVSILDKQQGSFKQVTSSGAVKNDLVISAYKPQKGFDEQFKYNAGVNLEHQFVEMHLRHQPIEPTIERTAKMLYSRMLAYYLKRQYEIHYDSSAFNELLARHFIEEDGLWFTNYQIEKYREWKKKKKLEDLSENANEEIDFQGKHIKTVGRSFLFVNDEKSALAWLNSFLDRPKDYSEIFTAFNQVSNIQLDKVPDLKSLLDENFVFEDGYYRRPSRQKEKQNKQAKRDKQLRQEFDALLLEARGKVRKLKNVRKEAVQKGFELCYQEGRFEDILVVGKKLDKKLIEAETDIREFIEVAEMEVEGI